MKIAILTAGLQPKYNGGTAITTHEIAKHAVKAGHDVNVITLDSSSGNLYHSDDGYAIHRVRSLGMHGITGLPGIVYNVLKIRPDVIHAQGRHMAISAFVASKLSGIPYILHYNGDIYLKWFMKTFATKFLMRHASRVTAQTEHMRLELLKYYSRDVQVVPNGVDIERFNKLSKSEARRLCGYSDQDIIVLTVGWLRPEKNIKNLVLAICWYNYYLNHKRIKYIIIGDGEQMDEIKQIIKDRDASNVILLGDIDNTLIPRYMNAADIYVNTSYSEGFPVAFLEAMACGLPIVAPNVCGIPEILDIGSVLSVTENCGVLVNVDDCSSIAMGIDLLLSNRSIYKSMSINCINRAKQYTWDNVVNKLYGDLNKCWSCNLDITRYDTCCPHCQAVIPYSLNWRES